MTVVGAGEGKEEAVAGGAGNRGASEAHSDHTWRSRLRPLLSSFSWANTYVPWGVRRVMGLQGNEFKTLTLVLPNATYAEPGQAHLGSQLSDIPPWSSGNSPECTTAQARRLAPLQEQAEEYLPGSV